MSDERELRNAFRSLVGDAEEPAADILASMQPRFRRARYARRATLVAMALPILAGFGLAIAVIDRGSGVASQSVATDGGDDAVDGGSTFTPVAPEVTAEPTPSPEPTVVESDESDDEWTIVIPTPTPTPDLTDIGEPLNVSPENGPGASAPTVTPSPAGETAIPLPPERDPTPDPEPKPSPSATSEPTVPTVMSEQFSSAGGVIVVEHDANNITNIDLTPKPGFSGKIESSSGHEAKVVFTKPGKKITVEIHFEHGDLEFDESS